MDRRTDRAISTRHLSVFGFVINDSIMSTILHSIKALTCDSVPLASDPKRIVKKHGYDRMANDFGV